jgi:hypothetical protein
MMTTTTKKRLPVAKKAQPTKKPAPKAAAQVVDVMSSVNIAHVPDQSVVDNYISRSFDIGSGKMWTDMQVFDYCYENGFNLLIEGPTGPGKTMATRAWAASRGMIMARVNSNNGIDKSAMFGKHLPDEDKMHFHWSDGAVTHVVRHGGVILINEVNFIPERVATILFGLLDDNREIVLDDKDGEIVRAHRGKGNCWCSEKDCDDKRVLIVADMNPNYQGTRELNTAFRNRWEMQLQWDYDPAVEAQLISSDSLRNMAEQLRDHVRNGKMQTPCSTNMLMEFERIAQDVSVDFAVMNFVNHYGDDERSAVALVADAHKENIRSDYDPVEPEVEAEAEEAEDITGPTTQDVYEWAFTEEAR